MSTSWMDLPADHPFGLDRPCRTACLHDRRADLRGSACRRRPVVDLGAAAADAGWTAPALREPTSTSSSPRARGVGRTPAVGTAGLTDPAQREPSSRTWSPLADDTMLLPFAAADYVDFYASEQHATNVGRIFRPDVDAADAELEAPADRLPRPRRHGRGVAAPTASGPAASARPRRGGTVFGPSRAARHRGRGGLRRRRAAPGSATGSASTRSMTTCSGRACSMTGAPATSRRGSTCPSARSWASPSRPCQPGWCRSRPWARPVSRCPAQDPSPPTARRPTGTTASTSSRCGSTGPRRRPPYPTCTGHPPRCWPT